MLSIVMHAQQRASRRPSAYLAVAQHLLLVRLELGAGCLLQSNRQAGDGVVVRAALREAHAVLAMEEMPRRLHNAPAARGTPRS